MKEVEGVCSYLHRKSNYTDNRNGEGHVPWKVEVLPQTRCEAFVQSVSWTSIFSLTCEALTELGVYEI